MTEGTELDFKEFKNKQFKHSLDKLLPQKMIDIVIEISKINPKIISFIFKLNNHSNT